LPFIEIFSDIAIGFELVIGNGFFGLGGRLWRCLKKEEKFSKKIERKAGKIILCLQFHPDLLFHWEWLSECAWWTTNDVQPA